MDIYKYTAFYSVQGCIVLRIEDMLLYEARYVVKCLDK